MSAPPSAARKLIWRAQSLAAALLFFVVRLLPFDAASAIGGWIGRTVGPRLAVTRRARRNLETAFPEMPPADVERIVRAMWDNLGRAVFEFPHLDRIRIYEPASPVEVAGLEHLDAMRDDGKAGILFSGHFANWELLPLVVAQSGLKVHSVYRAPNNPYMQPLFEKRGPGAGELLPKGARGARRAIQLLGQGEHLGMLIDQKMNDGIAVPFFGRDAMTAPALAQFALKYDCPVLSGRIERLDGARFRVTFSPPTVLVRTGDRHADVAAAMRDVNRTLEDWIRARPEQWLWLHNRWPD